MAAIILAFSSNRMCEQVMHLLHTGGYTDLAVCHSGAEVLRIARTQDSSIVISSYRLPDVTAHELFELGGGQIHPLVLLTPAQSDWMAYEDIFYLPSPIHRGDLLSSVKMMESLFFGMRGRSEPQDGAKRPTDEKALINEAKERLMARHHMTEQAAHRFIQKRSMDNKMKMVDTARLILEE